jgi:transglutaminase-like putative cysteine protease
VRGPRPTEGGVPSAEGGRGGARSPSIGGAWGGRQPPLAGPSRRAAALAYVLALALLARAEGSPTGLLAIGAVAVVLLRPRLESLGVEPSRERLRVLDLLVDVGLAAVATLGSTTTSPVAGGTLVAALARGAVLAGTIGLGTRVSGAVAFAAGPVAVALLAAGILLAPHAGLVDAVVALAALAAMAGALALAHIEDLDRDLRGSRVVAVGYADAPAPRQRATGFALAHASVTAALFLFGLAALPAREPGRRPASRPRQTWSATSTSREVVVGFEPEVRFDGPSALRSSDEDVGTVRIVGASLEEGGTIRGAGLESLDDAGFARPAPPVAPATDAFEDRAIEAIERPRRTRIEARLARVDGYLLARGTVRRLEGARAARDAAGNLAFAGRACEYVAYGIEPAQSEAELGALRAADVPALVALPATLRDDRALRELAGRLAHGESPHAKARAVERWLARNIDYDLQRSGGAGGVARAMRAFLFERRSGACGDFATAMVVLLRLSGVPARLAVGYRLDPRQRDASGAFALRSGDAHAWVEVPLDGAGFVSYDPTAPAAVPDASEPPGLDAFEPATEASAVDDVSRLPAGAALGVALAILGALGAIPAVAAIVRARRRDRARLAAPAALESEPAFTDAREALFALLRARGFVLDGPHTPLEVARELAAREGSGPRDAALVRAVRLYYAIRYSGRPVGARTLERLGQTVRAAR